MFNKKKNRIFNSSNWNTIKSCIKVGTEILNSCNSYQQNHQAKKEIEEEKLIYSKYLKYQKQLPHFSSKTDKFFTLLFIIFFTIMLIIISSYLEIIKNILVIIFLIIYFSFAINYFSKALSAPINMKNRIILTKRDRSILERRRRRQEHELMEKHKKIQEEENRRKEKSKQNEVLGIFAAMAALTVSEQLNKNNKVYVKGHYRRKPKRKRK